MASSDEYVEKLVTEAYKRELDQEENVFRSMPFFATALGVLATALGLARPAICTFDWAVLPMAMHAVLLLIAAAVVLALWFIRQSIRQRDFKNPMSERALIGYQRESFSVLRRLAQWRCNGR